MSNRIPWGLHEAAILLQGLLDVREKKVYRKVAVTKIPSQLRSLAARNGNIVDEKFRNVNGIGLQISHLEYALTNGKTGLGPAHKWQYAIIEIFRNDPDRYKKLLEEVNAMSESVVDTKSDFIAWLGRNMSAEKSKSIMNLITTADLLLRKNGEINTSVLDVSDLDTINTLISRLKAKKIIHSKQLFSRVLAYVLAVKDYKNKSESTSQNASEITPPQEASSTPVQENFGVDDNGIKNEQVNFRALSSLAFTKPVSLTYFDEVIEELSWRSLYVDIASRLVRDYPHAFLRLLDKSLALSSRTWIADAAHKGLLRQAGDIGQGYYVEINRSATDIIRSIKGMLDECGVHYDEVKIEYSSSNHKSEDINRVSHRKSDSNGNDFFQWMFHEKKLAEPTCHSYVSNLRTAERYAVEHHFPHSMLFGADDEDAEAFCKELLGDTDFVAYNNEQHHRLSAALTKYMEYLGAGKADLLYHEASDIKASSAPVPDIYPAPFRNVLSEHFPKGFRIASRLDMGRFRDFWEKEYGSELTEDDEAVRGLLSHITVRYQDFVYLPEAMASSETTQEILAYISECFSEGKNVIYFDALYKNFQTELSGSCINNSEMLRSYLAYINNGKYYVRKNYLAADASVEANPADEVRDYLITAAVPVTTDDLKKALSHIDGDSVFRAVAGHNSDEFIRNQKGEYFHADIIKFSQHETDTITDLIQNAIEDKGYMGGKELTDAVVSKLPEVMERYPFLNWLGLRDVIAYKFKDIFSFRGKIISAYGQDLSMSDVFAHFAATREHFTLAQLNSLKRDLDTTIYFDDVYANSLRINENEFVSRDQAHFDIEGTDTAISRFCTGDYIALKEINFFGSFPNAGFPWNGFLLEHYVADFSRKFKLLHIGFTAGTPVGAVVRRSSNIADFDELISIELAVSNIPLNRDSALQYLVDTGLLARRNYKWIEQALSKARLLRSKKG